MKLRNIILIFVAMLAHPISSMKAVYTGFRLGFAKSGHPGYPSDKTMKEILNETDQKLDEIRNNRKF